MSEKKKSVFREFSDSDGAMNAVFNHFRNIGICGGMFVAASWMLKYKNNHPTPLVVGLLGSALGVFAFFMFIANFRHGINKLQAVSIPKWLLWIIGVLYALSVATLLIYAIDNQVFHLINK